MTTNDPWADMASQLRTTLAGGLDVAGTVDETDVLAYVGKVAVELVIEATDLVGQDQAEAYAVLCDLLATRLTEGADQVFGCLVFASEPEPAPLATALDLMVRNDETHTFTPVLALSREQAEAMAEAGVSIDALIDGATDLIAVAADRRPPTTDTAETLLADLDELIGRHTQA